MKPKEAFEILRDTPIDIRSTRTDDIHGLYATAQNMALDALQRQMWIPCSERLPEDNVIVLVSGRALDYPCILANEKDLSYWYKQNVKNLAWMPLPEPYKEGGAE